MRALWGRAPGFFAAVSVTVAAVLVRLPVFPTVTMTQSSRSSGGDGIDWGVGFGTLDDHLRYERSWADHRFTEAVICDVAHPILLVLVSTGVATLLSLALARLGDPRVSGLDRVARRASVVAYGLFAFASAVQLALRLDIVRASPKPILAFGLVLFVGLVALAVRDGGSTRPVSLALRTAATIGLSVPLLSALLVLAQVPTLRHMEHVPYAWAASLVVCLVVLAWVRRTARRTLP